MILATNSAIFEARLQMESFEVMEGRKIIKTPVSALVIIGIPIPKHFTEKKRIEILQKNLKPVNGNDLDNFEKCIFDGIKGIVIKDDGLIIDLFVRKRYCDGEGFTEIYIAGENDIWKLLESVFTKSGRI